MSRWFWPSVVVGWLLISVGVLMALDQPGATRPPILAVYVLGLLLVHDLLIAPFTCLVGTRMHARDGRRRGTIQVAMILSVIVAAFSIPFIADWGNNPENPSLLPGNYALGLAIILFATWVTTAIALLRGRRDQDTDGQETT